MPGTLDAVLLQRMLNVALDRSPPLRTDGDLGPRSQAAIRDLQRLAGRQETGEADGTTLADARGLAARRGWKEQVAPGWIPPWLRIAEAEDGVKELSGTARNNPRILDYLATMPGLPLQDETPWCACFVAWCLLRAGLTVPPAGLGGPDASARSWREFGTPMAPPEARPGAIAVLFNRHPPAHTTSSGFHVGFLVERLESGVRLRGGNQGNAVNETHFPAGTWRVEAFRWPG
jgi:uncharacterized protein (TIGR02594 family)